MAMAEGVSKFCLWIEACTLPNKAYTDSIAVLYWNTQLLCAQRPKIIRRLLNIVGANVTMHRVNGPDNVVPDYKPHLPMHLLPSPAFSFRLDGIEELAPMDTCAIAYMSSILSTMQLRDRATIRPPERLLGSTLPKPTPYTTHDACDVSAGALYKHADGDHPYHLALPPQ